MAGKGAEAGGVGLPLPRAGSPAAGEPSTALGETACAQRAQPASTGEWGQPYSLHTNSQLPLRQAGTAHSPLGHILHDASNGPQSSTVMH